MGLEPRFPDVQDMNASSDQVRMLAGDIGKFLATCPGGGQGWMLYCVRAKRWGGAKLRIGWVEPEKWVPIAHKKPTS